MKLPSELTGCLARIEGEGFNLFGKSGSWAGVGKDKPKGWSLREAHDTLFCM